ncbi:hypothetical protein LMG27952_03116 [Paraburkholderia hiiakae]|uniref:Uncharacterized protein n=1 Tax=Paraburkholderia hiiakae TaxID=1081782 RepID=A0ABM8NP62_9BURK|nr:hypothetical protein LMG27952_03116 [Paraburkholderia hiiakae]
MGRGNSGESKLRCRPGDLARVVRSVDPSLIERRVLVLSPCSESEWVVLLMGAPTEGWTTHGDWSQSASQVIFFDSSLEPIERCHPEEVSLYAEGSAARDGMLERQTHLPVLAGHQ